jgi:hypothetical protein
MTMTADFERIEKEEIEHLKFPKEEVLKDKALIIARDEDLKRALSLGNLEHNKIKIFFADDSVQRLVETTVWGVTDKRVILKQGVIIPTNRIYKIII